jgi:hypothetical protein
MPTRLTFSPPQREPAEIQLVPTPMLVDGRPQTTALIARDAVPAQKSVHAVGKGTRPPPCLKTPVNNDVAF